MSKSEVVFFRAPGGFKAILAAIAGQEHVSVSSYLRALVMRDAAGRLGATEKHNGSNRMSQYDGPRGLVAA
jgi:hypothetical protein